MCWKITVQRTRVKWNPLTAAQKKPVQAARPRGMQWTFLQHYTWPPPHVPNKIGIAGHFSTLTSETLADYDKCQYGTVVE